MNRERSDKMEEEKKEKKGFFARLVSGLTKTRDNIVLMMISMKKSKRFLLWETLVYMPQRQFWTS